MNFLEIVLISISLGMDAFAVAICKGMAMHSGNTKKGIIIALYFGTFQALMPFIGYMLGLRFEKAITAIDHWLAFGLLAIIGTNMIKESFDKSEENINDDVSFKTMILLALATSIDALAIGITFAFLKVNIYVPITCIGIITFIMSFIGVKIGTKFGNKFNNKAETAGGIILIFMGVKILLEHLGIF